MRLFSVSGSMSKRKRDQDVPPSPASCPQTTTNLLKEACRNCDFGTLETLFLQGSSLVSGLVVKGVPLFIAACKAGCTRLVDVMLSKGANPNMRLKRDFLSALHLTCVNGHVDVVKLLLSKGAEIESFSTNRRTPLQLACYHGHLPVVDVLLSEGAQVNKVGPHAATALHFACIRGDSLIVDLLLSKGANIDLCAIFQITPLFIACHYGHAKVVDVLLSRGAPYNPEPIHDSRLTVSEKERMAELLFDQMGSGTRVLGNPYTPFQPTPLHRALEIGDVDLIEPFFTHGAIRVNDPIAETGDTLLHHACGYRNRALVISLLNKGANVNTLNRSHKWTPLQTLCAACSCEYTDNALYIAELLLNHGADAMKPSQLPRGFPTEDSQTSYRQTFLFYFCYFPMLLLGQHLHQMVVGKQIITKPDTVPLHVVLWGIKKHQVPWNLQIVILKKTTQWK